MRLKVMLEDGAFEPLRAHKTDAGLDLRSREEIVLWPGHSHTFDTGVHIEFPPGYYGKIESKSGLNVNDSIVSLGGVIDEQYTGSIAVKLYNMGDKMFWVEKGQKIVQLIVVPCLFESVDVVSALSDNTERGENGFGSTGK